MSAAERSTRLEKLANIDYQELRRSETGIHTRLQAVLFANVTIVTMIIGLCTHLSLTPNPSIPLLTVLFLVPSILSSFMLGLYIQDYILVRKRACFCTILGQFINSGQIPSGYYGWEDANANYSAILKRHRLTSARSWATKGDFFKWFLDEFRFFNSARMLVVSNMSAVLALIMFIFIPATCLAIAAYLVHDDLLSLIRASRPQYPLPSGGVVAAAVGYLVFMGWYVNRARCLLSGRLTFFHLQLLYEMILETAPPYRPSSPETQKWLKEANSLWETRLSSIAPKTIDPVSVA